MRSAHHPVDEPLPLGKLLVYGFQHVVAFYAGAVLVPLLIGKSVGLSPQDTSRLVMADLFTCGVASIVQSVGIWRFKKLQIGVRLPLVQGVTIASVGPAVIIAKAHGGGGAGLVYVYGAVIATGLIAFLLAPAMGRMARLFPPVVTGTVFLVIGVCLLPIGAKASATNPHTGRFEPANPRWALYSALVIVVIIFVGQACRGFVAGIAVLLGLAVGSLVAWRLGDLRVDGISRADYLGFTSPMLFGLPRFDLAATLVMLVIVLVTMVETTGSVFATGELVDRPATVQDVTRALRADGAATVFGGFFNSFPYDTFAQNVGLVRLTGVRSRWVVTAAGAIMVLLGCFPKAAAAVSAIPEPVLGGASLTLFAAVALVGVGMLAKTDLNDQRNLAVVGTSLAAAAWLTVVNGLSSVSAAGGELPLWANMLYGNGVVVGCVLAVVLGALLTRPKACGASANVL